MANGGELLVSYFQHPTDFYPTVHGGLHSTQAAMLSSHEALFSQAHESALAHSSGMLMKQRHLHGNKDVDSLSNPIIPSPDDEPILELKSEAVENDVVEKGGKGRSAAESKSSDPMDSSSDSGSDDGNGSVGTAGPFTPILHHSTAPVVQLPFSFSAPNLPQQQHQQQSFLPQNPPPIMSHQPTLPYLQQSNAQPQSLDDQLWQQTMFLPAVLDPYQQLQLQQLQMQQQGNMQYQQQLLQQQQFPFNTPSLPPNPYLQQQLQQQLRQQLQQQYHLQQQLHSALVQQNGPIMDTQLPAQLHHIQQLAAQSKPAPQKYSGKFKQQQPQQQKPSQQPERSEPADAQAMSQKGLLHSRLLSRQNQQDLQLEIPGDRDDMLKHPIEPKDEFKSKANRSPTSQSQSPKPARPIHFHTVQTPQRIQNRQNQQFQQQNNPQVTPTTTTTSTSSPSRSLPVLDSPSAATVAQLRKKPMKENERLLVIEPEVLCLRQGDAAKRLNMKPSTLSKRWKTSLPNRVWPYRAAKKLQKQIVSLQDLETKGFNVRSELDQLTNIRKATLDPAVIVINDKLEDSIRSYANESENQSPNSSPNMTPPALMIPNLPMFSATSGNLSSSGGVLPPFTPPIYPPSSFPGVSSSNPVERPPSST